jgi:hypothetical protein
MKSGDGCFVGNQKILFRQAIEKLTEFNSKYERNEHTKKSNRNSKSSKRKAVPKLETSATEF